MKTDWKISGLPDDGQASLIHIQMRPYNRLVLAKGLLSCVFESEGDPPLTFYFVDNADNLRRFVFSLADAGLLMPFHERDLRGHYEVLPKPSFLPSGEYTPGFASESEVIREVFRRVAQQTRSITEDSPAFYPQFASRAVQLIHRHFFGRANNFLKEHPDKRISNLKFSRESCLKSLFQKIKPLHRFSKLQGRLRTKQSKFDAIERDIASVHWPEKVWTVSLRSLCGDVAKAALLIGRVYV
jgi:hypothetical protein